MEPKQSVHAGPPAPPAASPKEAKVNLYTFGYSEWEPSEVNLFATEYGILVVDVRMYPKSKNPQWRQQGLMELLGERYMHCPDLGNVNFRGGPIQLKNPARAVEELGPLMGKRTLALMCKCANVICCHRILAAEYLQRGVAEQLGEVNIVHLGGPELMYGSRQGRLF